jgi:hypothetical protein
MRTRFLGVAGLLVILSAPFGLLAHGGRTDSLGCHHNRKAGGYHCHSGQLAGRSFSSKAEALKALSGSKASQPTRPVRATTAGEPVSREDLRKLWQKVNELERRLKRLEAARASNRQSTDRPKKETSP